MLEKSNKISVLNKMSGLEKSKDIAVPQNSIANLCSYFPHTADLNMNQSIRMNTAEGKCPYCENMAKHLLYLEGLIHNNYNKKRPCKLCNSSLKYLQNVNHNIVQVFGNFGSIVKAAKAFQTRTSANTKFSGQKNFRASAGSNPVAKSIKSVKSLKSLKIKSSKSTKSVKTSKPTTSKPTTSKPMTSKPSTSKPTTSKPATNKSTRSSEKKKQAKAIKNKTSIGSKTKSLSRPNQSTHKLKKALHKVVRSASQYGKLRSQGSKNNTKAKKTPSDHYIPLGILKKNMPKGNPRY